MEKIWQLKQRIENMITLRERLRVEYIGAADDNEWDKADAALRRMDTVESNIARACNTLRELEAQQAPRNY